MAGEERLGKQNVFQTWWAQEVGYDPGREYPGGSTQVHVYVFGASGLSKVEVRLEWE